MGLGLTFWLQSPCPSEMKVDWILRKMMESNKEKKNSLSTLIHFKPAEILSPSKKKKNKIKKEDLSQSRPLFCYTSQVGWRGGGEMGGVLSPFPLFPYFLPFKTVFPQRKKEKRDTQCCVCGSSLPFLSFARVTLDWSSIGGHQTRLFFVISLSLYMGGGGEKKKKIFDASGHGRHQESAGEPQKPLPPLFPLQEK